MSDKKDDSKENISIKEKDKIINSENDYSNTSEIKKTLLEREKFITNRIYFHLKK